MTDKARDEADRIRLHARNKIGGIETPDMRGDCLAILIVSAFEDLADEDEELDESGTWKQSAVDATHRVLDAILAHHEAALTALGASEYARGEADMRERAAEYPAEAVIEGPNIVIRVPISAIPVAFEACPDAPRDDEADPLYTVTDAATFAKGIVRYLNDEEEDGTTRIHRMFDSAMIEALEQGEEGIEEVAAIRALKTEGEG